MKRFILFLLLGLCIFCSLPFLPVVRSDESYRSFFRGKQLQKKIQTPIPQWMEKQLSSDFSLFKEVTQEMIDRSFEMVKDRFERYRIFRNTLYKYAPKISSKDNEFEKALKTLLIYASVPDVDFIYCPMDGLPEKYMPQDFYLLGDAKMQAPILAKARLKTAPHIILIPDQFSLSDNWFEVTEEILTEDIDWEEKQEIALWRGGFTDIGVPNGNVIQDYQTCPRYLICKLDPTLVDAKLPWAGSEEFDETIREEKVWGGAASKKQHLACKYLPVLDGHMCTYPGYQWRLLSKSAPFKQESEEEQWFYSALKPYEHFIPIKNDMSDLTQKIKWAKTHDEEVKSIAEQGRNFALNHLLIEDDYLYLYLALQKYAELQKGSFDNWDRFQCIHYRKRSRVLKKIFQKIGACFGSYSGKPRAGSLSQFCLAV